VGNNYELMVSNIRQLVSLPIGAIFKICAPDSGRVDDLYEKLGGSWYGSDMKVHNRTLDRYETCWCTAGVIYIKEPKELSKITYRLGLCCIDMRDKEISCD